jgi:taurine dioxygenase
MSIDVSDVTVERLAGSCGAIVRGIDVTRPQSPDDVEAILRLLDEHLVVAFPGQRMDLDRLEAFTDELGGRDVTPYVTPVEGRPFVIRVIKEPSDELNFANAWHTDLSYLPAPPAYTVLHAHDVPRRVATRCGRTSTSPSRRCRTRSRSRSSACERRTRRVGVRHRRLPRGGGRQELDEGRAVAGSACGADASAGDPSSPHRPTGAVCQLGVHDGHRGMDPDEGRALLARLTAHATHPNFTCRLRWEPDMVTIWDNSATQHFAINDYPGARRELFRTSVGGSAPQPIAPGV